MKLNCIIKSFKELKKKRSESKTKWRLWFSYKPVKLLNGDIVIFEFIYKRYNEYYGFEYKSRGE